jgi:hypothetical protein
LIHVSIAGEAKDEPAPLIGAGVALARSESPDRSTAEPVEGAWVVVVELVELVVVGTVVLGVDPAPVALVVAAVLAAEPDWSADAVAAVIGTDRPTMNATTRAFLHALWALATRVNLLARCIVRITLDSLTFLLELHSLRVRCVSFKSDVSFWKISFTRPAPPVHAGYATGR